MTIFATLTGRDLLMLAAGFGSLVVLGLWDNQRSIEQALDAGYATKAVVTGTQRHARTPLSLVAFDGLRPRFLDERQSWDLKWRGQDGVEHERQYVPVTLATFRSIPAAGVPIKVVDQSGSVPVVVLDVQDRLASLEDNRIFWIWVAIVGWIGLGWNLLLRRAHRVKSSASFKRRTAERTTHNAHGARLRPR